MDSPDSLISLGSFCQGGCQSCVCVCVCVGVCVCVRAPVSLRGKHTAALVPSIQKATQKATLLHNMIYNCVHLSRKYPSNGIEKLLITFAPFKCSI